MKSIYHLVTILMAGVIVIAFFLPWVGVESEAVGVFSKVLTGKNQSRIEAISAFRVPVLANSDEARLMVSIIQIFSPGIKNADKKSYLIWVVPLCALALVILGFCFEKNAWYNLIVGVFLIGLFVGAVYKIQTTDLDKLILRVNIGFGLWVTLLGFLGIGILSLVNGVSLFGKKKVSQA